MQNLIEYSPELKLQKLNQSVDFDHFFATNKLFTPDCEVDNKIDLYRIPVRYLKWLITYCIIADGNEDIARINANHHFRILVIDGKNYKLNERQNPYPLFGKVHEDFASFPKITSKIVKWMEKCGLLNDQNYQVFNLYLFLTHLLSQLDNINLDLTR